MVNLIFYYLSGVTLSFLHRGKRKLMAVKIGMRLIVLDPLFYSFIFVAVEPFNSSHTGELIAEKLNSILEKNGVSTKTRWILTDNAANMIKVGDLRDLLC